MKLTRGKLKQALQKMADQEAKPFAQRAPLSLITPDGRQVMSVSASYVLQFVDPWKLIGFGRNGVLEKVKADVAPRARPLFLQREFGTAARENTPMDGSGAERNVVADRLTWGQQPMNAESGRTGRISTIHLPLS